MKVGTGKEEEGDVLAGLAASGMSLEGPRVSRTAGVMLAACDWGVRAHASEAAGFYAADKQLPSWQETAVMHAAHPAGRQSSAIKHSRVKVCYQSTRAQPPQCPQALLLSHRTPCSR